MFRANCKKKKKSKRKWEQSPLKYEKDRLRFSMQKEKSGDTTFQNP